MTFPRLRRAPPGGWVSSFKTLLATEGGLERLQCLLAAGEEPGPSYPLEKLRVLAPVPNPAKIVCIGLNYLDHAMETGAAVPEEPVIFTKFATAIVGPGAPIILPPVTNQWIMKRNWRWSSVKGKNVPEEEAMEYVAGYTVFNDVSARDLQFRDGQWTKGEGPGYLRAHGPVPGHRR